MLLSTQHFAYAIFYCYNYCAIPRLSDYLIDLIRLLDMKFGGLCVILFEF